MARPTIYTEELALDVCSKLAAGMPLVRICLEESMPSKTTVYRWLVDSEVFRDMYARAREDQADTLADEIIEIADATMLGATITTKANGEVEKVEGDMLQHRKLRVEARKWTAAKLKPKKYGDLVRQEHSGPGGGPIALALPSYDDLRAEIERRRRPSN